MQLQAAIKSRRMVRAYDPTQPVPRSVIDDLLGLAIRAPSAGFSQGWHFLVLDDAAARQRFWDATAEDGPPDRWLTGLQTAPALIVVLSDEQAYRQRYAEPDKGSVPPEEQDWPVPYWHIDAGMAAMLVLLGAVDAGLGACFFGVPSPGWAPLRAAFGLPDRLAPVGVISLGTPAPDRRSPSLDRGRRGIEAVVSYGSFGSSAPAAT